MATAWNRVRDLFESACELAPEERKAFLTAACEGDTELEGAVAKLLAHDTATDSMLDGQAAIALPAPVDADAMVGTRIGPFVIRSVIGSGGMSTVFAADQDRPRRSVALKMMRQAWSHSDAQRLEFESEVLARLRHPGIAQVYAVGTFDRDGVQSPYIAMEHIEGGATLDKWLETRKPNRDQVLEMLFAVSDAIHHAHLRGVVHRDLKPANILVDADDRPKVIDFGIAALADPEVTRNTLQGQVVGTLQYMSPEQLEGAADVDGRSDVYALGIVLFELLTGKPPHDLGKTSLPGAIQVLTNARPIAPSTVNATLPRELDWIVLKATATEPQQRYASAADFATDLQRFTRREPLSAGPPSRIYASRKFVERHALGVLVAACAVILLIAATAWALVSRDRAVDAETIALGQKAELQTRADTLTRTNAALVTARNDAADRSEYLAKVNGYLRGWLSGAYSSGKGAQTRLVDVLAQAGRELGILDVPGGVRSVLHNAIGVSYLALRLLDDAEPHLEKAYQLAHEHLGVDDQETLTATNNLALLRQARGQLDDAERLLREVIAHRSRVHGPRAPLTAQSKGNLANLLAGSGKVQDALVLYQEAREALVESAGEADPMTLQLTRNLCTSLLQLRRRKEAEELARENAAAAIAGLGPNHVMTLKARDAVARCLMAARQPAEVREAATILEDLTPRFTEALGRTHSSTLGNLQALAETRYLLEDLEGAVEGFRELIDRMDSARGVDPVHRIMCEYLMCTSLRELSRWEEVDRRYASLQAKADQLLPVGHMVRGRVWWGHGVSLLWQKNFAESEKRLVEAERHLAGTVLRPRLLESFEQLYEEWGQPDKLAQARQRLGQ